MRQPPSTPSRRTTGTPTSRRTPSSRPPSATRASTSSSRIRRPRAPRRRAPGTRTSSTAPAGSIPTRSTPNGRITLSALRESAGSDIAQLDTGLLDWNIDPLDGIPASFLQIPDYQRLETPDDGRRMLARWRAMATCTDRHLETIRRSLENGRVACVAPGVRTVRILEGLLHDDTADWPLLAPLADLDDLGDEAGWTTAERQRFATELTAAVDDEIRPAFVRLHDALVTEVLPNARSSNEPGIGHVAGGLDAYRQLIRVHTSLDLDAETLHQVGLDEIARIDAEIADLAGRTIGTREPRRRPRPPALRPGPVLHDARGGLRQGRGVPRPRQRGDPRLVRAAARDPVRGRPHGRARGGALDDRVLPRAGGRRVEARPVLHQHLAPRDPAALRGRGARVPRVGPGPPPADRDRPGARPPARVPQAPRARRRSSRAGACTRSGCPTRWACTAATSTGSACSRSTPGGRRGSSSTPGCTRSAGRATGRSSSCSTTRRSRPTTSRTRSTATSSMPGQALAYKMGQLELLRLRAEARATLGRPVRHPRLPRRGARQRRHRPADAPRRRRVLGRLGARTGLMPDAPGGSAPAAPLVLAARSLSGVLRNRDIRSLEACWTLGVAADWALLVVALLVAYDAGRRRRSWASSR